MNSLKLCMQNCSTGSLMQSMQCPTAADSLNLNNHPRTAYILGQVIQFHLWNFIKSIHIMLYYSVYLLVWVRKGIRLQRGVTVRGQEGQMEVHMKVLREVKENNVWSWWVKMKLQQCYLVLNLSSGVMTWWWSMSAAAASDHLLTPVLLHWSSGHGTTLSVVWEIWTTNLRQPRECRSQ